jgi:hypothetical protein
VRTLKREVVLSLLFATVLPVSSSAGDDLLGRAASVNPNLHSYTATLKAHVKLTTFPFLATDLEGTYYHKDPSMDKLDIHSGLPGIAKQFSKLYPHIVPPEEWNVVFIISKGADDGKATTYTLVPRKRGNIDHIDATLDDKTATIASMRWNYYNGGSATMSNSYSAVAGHLVVTAQTGNVDEPEYKGDINSTLSDYRFNPNLPDSIFQEE